MKTCKNLLPVLLSAFLLITGLTGCEDHDIPAANTSLSYPAGEMTLGEGTYTSATPTVSTSAAPQYAVTGVKHNGAAADLSLATVNASTGVINFTPASDPSAVGDYLISVRLMDGDNAVDYPDVLKIVVKGIVFENPEVTAVRGEELTIPVDNTYLVQETGTVFTLEAPEGDADYAHFSVDKATCAVTVAPEAEAGVYPISIRVTNRTNPNGTVFTDVLRITVESRPYDLKYTPDAITLIPLEGHTSPRPTVRAAAAGEGTQVSYALLDDFGGVFSIDPATGVITLPEDTQLVTTTAKTYELQVRATNAKGTTSFPGAYTVTVDPDKKAEPVTAVAYPDAFPVNLKPGQAWTSERPSVTGSTVGIEWSLDQAPAGVTIDRKTGVVTMAEGHRMPLQTEDNKLTVLVTNQGMDTPFQAQLGDFSIDPVLWQIAFVTNSKDNSLVNSGIGNMDRYSFSGKLETNYNKTDQSTATTIAVKNGWGKASATSANGVTCIDATGINNANTEAGNSNMNNDWVVSSEIEIPAGSFNPAICFGLVHQYGTNPQNILELYIVEIDAQNVYVKGEQDQNDRGLDAQPGDLVWTPLATTDQDNAEIPEKIEYNLVSGSGKNLQNFPTAPRSFDISAYKGKKVRFALRYWNPSENNNNSRTYRIESLRVEDSLAD